MEGLKELANPDLAVERVKRFLKPLASERVSLLEAVGRVLAEDIYSEVDVPPFDRATMDGYAVRAEDTFGASFNNPVRLRYLPYSEGGEIKEGEAMEIATGAPMPRGSDAVVMYEHANRVGDFVEVFKPVPKLRNVSIRGEDVAKGSLVMKRGRIISPWDVGVLASLGIKEVPVVSRPRVYLISTGEELVELEEWPAEGKIINSSKFVLISLLKEAGAIPMYGGIVKDDVGEIREAVKKGLKEADLVITTGGLALGTRDRTVEAIRSLNPEILIRGMAIRPGRPTSLAVVEGKPVAMLSGFPVASAVGFEAVVRPLLEFMMGSEPRPVPKVKGRLTRRVTTPINVRSYVRVRVLRKGRELVVEPLAVTGSGILSTLTKGNGLLIIPETREGYDEGDEVEVMLFREVEPWGSA